jgi:hypothetical protein
MTERDFDFDVFLSHSSADADRVLRLTARLRDGGLRVWSIGPGEDIPRSIERGLATSRRIVACWSRQYWASEWVRAESGSVLFFDPNNEKLRYLPVMLEDCEPPETFARFNYLDYRREDESVVRKLLALCRRQTPEAGFIQPLHVTEDRFLQLLLSEFVLRRTANGGVELRICFDDETPSIWSSRGKRYLLAMSKPADRLRYQEELDGFLFRQNRGTYEFRDSNFSFRYASGGTLPIITLTDGSTASTYYCLFYREIHPIGWNIANGGCDNRTELLNPQLTMERELHEELVIADFETDTRYTFPGDDDPAHNVARRLWGQAHKPLDPTRLKTREVPIDWHSGPDSLHIQVGHEDAPIIRGGFYLNINGEDFGIEMDRVATIHLPSTVTLFDGELEGTSLVKAPVGLFATESFDELLRGQQTQEGQAFRPDVFFFDAQRFDASKGADIEEILSRFKAHFQQFRTSGEMANFESSVNAGTHLGLCPVTARIVERHLHATGRRTS